MKKTILAIAISTAILTACSNYHIEQNSRNGINVPVDSGSKSEVDSATSVDAKRK